MYFKKILFLFSLVVAPLNATYKKGDTVMINNGDFKGRCVTIWEIHASRPSPQEFNNNNPFTYLLKKNKNMLANLFDKTSKKPCYYKVRFYDDCISTEDHIVHKIHLSPIPGTENYPLLKATKECIYEDSVFSIRTIFNDTELVEYWFDYKGVDTSEKFYTKLQLLSNENHTKDDLKKIVESFSSEQKPVYLIAQPNNPCSYHLCFGYELEPLDEEDQIES